MNKLKDKNYEYLKQSGSTSQTWRAYFDVEYADDSGSFRKSISSIVEELHSTILPVLIPTKNNTLKKGEFQDRWMINPGCTNSTHLEMYRFIGALMGYSFRSGSPIDFKFTPLLYKKLLCDPLTIEDVECFDTDLAKTLKDLRKQSKGKREDFKDPGLKFVAVQANGNHVNLCENGDTKSVTYDNAEEYVNLVLAARFKESDKQMECITKGFNVVFPKDVMRILPWKDIEERVRGQEVTIPKLREISTYYSMSADDEWGKKFWAVLEGFSKEELQRYLRYIVGRTRLPCDEKIKDINHYINLKDNYYSSNHDEIFPDIYPYNFQMYFPRYSTVEIARKKILEHIVDTEKYYLHSPPLDSSGSSNDQNNNVNDEDDDISSDSEDELPVAPSAPREPNTVFTNEEDNTFGNLFADDDY
jgi:hypothetical protein